MKIVLSSLSEKQFKKLPKFDQIAVAEKIRNLEATSFANEEKVKGYKDIFRIRVGDYRIVYRKFTDRYYIILIRHRKDVYEFLQRLLGK